MNKFFYSLSLLLFFFLCEELRADTVITEIRTEQLVAPVGIDAPAPRLSWQITSTERNVMQTGYHILVSSSPEKLNKNEIFGIPAKCRVRILNGYLMPESN